MKLKKVCGCQNNRYRLIFSGLGFLRLSGVQCRHCHQNFAIRSVYKNMSMAYVDILAKVIFLYFAIEFLILGFPLGFLFLLGLIALLNYGMYPLLLKTGILSIEKRR